MTQLLASGEIRLQRNQDGGLIEDAYLFSAFRYIARGGRKLYPGMDARESKIMDLRKAREYLDFDIDRLEREGSE